jgi:hypothetical protein
LSLIFLSGILAVNAQNLSFGIQAGTNFSVQSQISDYYNNSDIRTGLHAGIFSRYDLSQHFSLQAEINYDQLGSQTSAIKNNFDYLNVPLLLNYSFGKSYHTPMTFKLYAGPYAGFLLNAETITQTPETNETRDLNENTNSSTMGVIGGFGIRYPVNNQNIMLDLRLGLGLTSYDKNNYEPKNKYIGLSLGYEF